MQTPAELAREIVRREGGYVNDPDDPGGATKYGVTIHTLRRLGMDLDRDGDVDTRDVKALTEAQAVEIFLAYYFERPGIASLPDTIQASVFDMYVNSGSNAVKILQRLINDTGLLGTLLIADGAIGPLTIRAAHRVADELGGYFPDAYGVARRDWYYRLADRRKSSRKYATRRDGGKGGWITRAEEFISPRYHLTDAQHRDRVAAWG